VRPTGYEPGTRYRYKAKGVNPILIALRQKSKSETSETSYHEHQIKSRNSQRLRIRFPYSAHRLRIRLSIFGPQAPHPSLCIRSTIPSGDAQSRSYKYPPRKSKIYPHSNFQILKAFFQAYLPKQQSLTNKPKTKSKQKQIKKQKTKTKNEHQRN
jgi:hypothetical protein